MTHVDLGPRLPGRATFLKSLEGKLDNWEWLRTNRDALLEHLPDTWTHKDNWHQFSLPFRFKIKLLGIEYQSDDQLAYVMAHLQKIGMLQWQGLTFKANKNWEPPK
jgi:hypothetical protein